MGVLREASSGRTVELESKQTIGRAPGCVLRLHQRYVSAQHASIQWDETSWWLCDLGSRNGTFCAGVRVPAGKRCTLMAGDSIAFGKRTGPAWTLADDRPPRTMIVPIDGSAPVPLADILALPSSDNPRVMLYADRHGDWVIEDQDDPPSRISNGCIFEVAGRFYRFCCGTTSVSTLSTLLPNGLHAAESSMELLVSGDDRLVAMRLTRGSGSIEVAPLKHADVLLNLAKRRLRDQSDGFAEHLCGWVDYEELVDTGIAPAAQLNVVVYQVRQMFAESGAADAGHLIERRPLARQLRIGHPFSIVRCEESTHRRRYK
jgi:hypothetical protein